jgi:hypothetical protein
MPLADPGFLKMISEKMAQAGVSVPAPITSRPEILARRKRCGGGCDADNYHCRDHICQQLSGSGLRALSALIGLGRQG